MCAASRNFRPPYFTNGILRLVSSTSRTSLWLALRNSTAWRLSGTFASRRLSTSVHTYSACVCSSSTVTARGRAPSPRIDSRYLRCWRGASAMTALATSSTGCVER